jgi:hypothetical protein
VELDGDDAELLWERLIAGNHDGWWPILIGNNLDEQGLAQSALFAAPVDSITAEAASIDVPELLQRWTRDSQPDPSDEFDYIGEWPASLVAPHGLYVPRDLRTLEPQPTVIAIVAVPDQSLVPAAIGFGGWNSCPRSAEHVAVLRYWNQSHGARLISMSSDVVEMVAGRPPATRDQAMRLAAEHFAYCSDIVYQGVGTVSDLAASLLDAPNWYFWWD